MYQRGDNMTSVKKNNRQVLLELLHMQGNISRKRIAHQMHLTPAAITLIVSELIEEGIISEGASISSNNSSGRREVLLHINAQSRIALGVSIGLHDAVLSASYLDGSLIFSSNIPVINMESPKECVKALCVKLSKLIKKHGIKPDDIIGLGVAVRGIVDESRHFSVNSFGTFFSEKYPPPSLF